MNKKTEAHSVTLSLDGEWDFTYQADPGPELRPPAPEAFDCRMPVPAYWDDHHDRLEKSEFWSRDCQFNPFRPIRFPLGQGKPPDCSLPWLIGTGWYRKRFAAPDHALARLYVGGAVMDVTVFVNGKRVGTHEGHLTPAMFDLGPHLNTGGDNELILAVSNRRGGRASTVTRGYKGRSAGIYDSVTLHCASARVDDLYIHPKGENGLRWRVRLTGARKEHTIAYALREAGGRVVLSGEIAATGNPLAWDADAASVACWSDRQPNLYTAVVELRDGNRILDRVTQPFGRRSITTDGHKILLNGRPVFLRGHTEHAYFPLTCTPPRDKQSYRENIRALQSLGFNFVRFHTWAPPMPYIQACNELGMLVQVEAPNGFSDGEWDELLATYRKHPAVVLYCCGNETTLDDPMLDRVEEMAVRCRAEVPDALFCPMHGMDQVDWRLQPDTPGVVNDPFLHHPQRLERVQTFSDVLAPQKGPLGISHTMDDLASSQRRMAIYRHPVLVHEMGILDTYINLDLENRYSGTRIGPDLFAAARAYLQREGLYHRASRYHANACRRVASLRKAYIENVRMLNPVAGYDYLGAFDYHWHRTGYSVGIVNEFFELKPGESAADVRRYNGESVLLCDLTSRRNFCYGESLEVTLNASLFGPGPLSKGALGWMLHDAVSGQVFARGGWDMERVPAGVNSELGKLSCTLPSLDAPKKLTLAAWLSDASYEIENRWDIWLFPPCGKTDAPQIVTGLDERAFQRLSRGESLLLLGPASFPSLPYMHLMGGRTVGTAATVIEEHPLMARFPHQGFCDWQFQSMLAGGRGVIFDELPFDPIIEFVSSYKMIVKQSAVFEWQVGAGRLLVCGLALPESDPAAMFLLREMLAYLSSEAFCPRVCLATDQVRRLAGNFRMTYDRDEGQDGNAEALLKE